MPRIVDSVLVHDDGPNQSTEFDQCVPVATVACEPRRLDCEHATDAAFTDPRQQALEARPVAAATRATQIIVDDLDSGPAELPGAIGEPVLTVPALLVVQELIGCRLTDIDARASGQMLSRDLGHWRWPPLCQCCRNLAQQDLHQRRQIGPLCGCQLEALLVLVEQAQLEIFEFARHY